MNAMNLKLKKSTKATLLTLALMVHAPASNAALVNGNGADIMVTEFMPPAALQLATLFGSITAAITASIGTVATPGALTNPIANPMVANFATINGTLMGIQADQKITQAESSKQLVEQLRNNQVAAPTQIAATNGVFMGAPTTCAEVASVNVATVAEQTVAYQNQKYSSGSRSRLSKAGTPQDQVKEQTDQHRKSYCDPATDPKKCTDQSGTTASVPVAGGSVKLLDADVKSSSMFTGTGDGKTTFSNLTFTKEQMAAARAFSENTISVGDTPRGLSPAELNKPEGKVYHGLKLAYTARISMSQDVLSDIISFREPIQGSDDTLKAMLDSTTSNNGLSQYIQGRIDAIKKFYEFSTPKVSAIELLDIQVKSRTNNPGWIAFVDTALPAQLARESVLMQAASLNLQYMLYRQNEKIMALQAITAAESAKTNTLPRVQAALNAIK